MSFDLNSPGDVAPVAVAEADPSGDHFAGYPGVLYDATGGRIILSVQSDADCRETYGQSAIGDDMLCAVPTAGGCPSGSSGAPLVMLQYAGDPGTLVGVASWGTGFCPIVPEVFADVAYLRSRFEVKF